MGAEEKKDRFCSPETAATRNPVVALGRTPRLRIATVFVVFRLPAWRGARGCGGGRGIGRSWCCYWIAGGSRDQKCEEGSWPVLRSTVASQVATTQCSICNGFLTSVASTHICNVCCLAPVTYKRVRTT
jgi:hypothetical protein